MKRVGMYLGGVLRHGEYHSPLNLEDADMTQEEIEDYKSRGWNVVIYKNIAVIL